MPNEKIILFELNEVPTKIIDYFVRLRPNSWLAETAKSRKEYSTFMPNTGHLSPWNTWPSFHRGVSNDKHFLSDFNQDTTEVDREFPPIWSKLSQKGASVGVFGSLHSFPVPADKSNVAFHVPDVFAPSPDCVPSEVALFQEINLALSRESARNVNGRVPIREAAKLAMGFRKLGFQFGTVTDVVGQILSERFDSWKTTRRRTYQSVIGFDVFMKQLVTKRPDFVTFFTNHVASSMHRYWAAAFPDDYEEMKFSDDWLSLYENEVLWTMEKADMMLRQLGDFVRKNPEYVLVCASSMGQDAVECEPIETQLYVTNHTKLMRALGMALGDYEVLPAMVPQFNYRISARGDEFEKTLVETTVNGNPLAYRRAENGFFSLDFGHRNLKEVVFKIKEKEITYSESGLENTVVEDMSNASAYHVPEGHLWAYHPKFEFEKHSGTQISALDFFDATSQAVLGKQSNGVRLW